ncbi:hypothetical protein VTO42DRAFT_5415 [Malbranchea cinnamomea]
MPKAICDTVYSYAGRGDPGRRIYQRVDACLPITWISAARFYAVRPDCVLATRADRRRSASQRQKSDMKQPSRERLLSLSLSGCSAEHNKRHHKLSIYQWDRRESKVARFLSSTRHRLPLSLSLGSRASRPHRSICAAPAISADITANICPLAGNLIRNWVLEVGIPSRLFSHHPTGWSRRPTVAYLPHTQNAFNASFFAPFCTNSFFYSLIYFVLFLAQIIQFQGW